jgi:conjugative transfer pilus assembly protein TraH
MKHLGLGLFFFMSTHLSYGSVSNDLDNFFNGIGLASNTTNPSAFESQAAGFFGGGSLYARSQVRQYQLVQLDLPSYRAGCGGIDLYTGALSFISHDKLVDLGKSVMTNTGAYAVDVMLATTVPELKGVRDYLQGLEQVANQASINSCEMSQNLVGGIWPKTVASQQKICKDQGTLGKSGLFSDYTKARMECAGNGFEKAIDKANKDATAKKQVVMNKNLVWSILQSKSFLSADSELAEMVMSLTGTIIIDKEGKVTNVPSLAGSPDLINALLGSKDGGGRAKIWRCTDKSSTSQCMSVTLEEMSVSQEKSMTHRIHSIIESINEKVQQDEKPSASEINFLSLTSIPVLKFLTVLNSSQYGNAAVDMDDYSMLIAQDLLQNYLHELLQEVGNATAGSELNEDLVKTIEERIKRANQMISSIDPKVGRKLQEKLALIEHIARIEKQVASTLSSTQS